MKISIRLQGRVTSVQIKSSIATLYCMVFGEDGIDERKAEALVQDAVYEISQKWRGNGRGFSTFVTDCMIEQMIDSEELFEYRRLNRFFGGLP